jgi:hypothetical protein
MQLTCENLRRQLNRRTELLSHIAVTHQIAVAGLGKVDEGDEALGRGSTITRARARRRDLGQRRRALPHADGHLAEPAEGGAPVRLFRPLRGLPSQPAMVHEATTKLDLFRSCSDVEAAAVDLDADIRPGLDDDAVES